MIITSFVDESQTKKILQIEVPADEVGTATDRVARSLAKSVKLPGFRPGKVPPEIIRKRFADELRHEVLESLLESSLRDALEEKGLLLLGDAKVEEVVFEAGKPLTFKATVEVRPPLAVKDYRGLKVPTEPTEPTGDEIDRFLEELRESRAHFEPIDDRPVADGDFALIDIRGTYPAGDGADFERLKVLVEVGGERTMAEITANLRNAEPGVTVTFQKDFPEDTGDPDFAGKTVLYHVQLHALKKKVPPPLDEAFAREVLTAPEGGEAPPEGEALTNLRKIASMSLVRDKERSLVQKRRRAVLDGLLAMHEVEAPESMVEAEIDSGLREYARMLARQGVDLKQAKLDWTRLREEARPSAVRRVKEFLLLDAVGSEEKIEASDEEVEAEIRRQAPGAGSKPAELKAALAKSGRLDALREEIRLEKVVSLLLAEAIPAAGA